MIRTLAVCIVLLVSIFDYGQAQIKLVPVPVSGSSVNQAGRISQHVSMGKFPLWEDFSGAVGIPDTSRWINSNGIWINDGQGIDKPTFNVATFDGVDASGNLYSPDPEEIGFTDSLVSKPIDLSNIPAGFENTVYLSFYYQKEGNGEFPDDVDFIELHFRKADSTWIKVWPASVTDLTASTNTFERVMLPVDPNEYFHEHFQFRFRSSGRMSGPYDTWQVDYIYLDQGREQGDFDMWDRAITEKPNSIFKGYSAVPSDQLKRADQNILQIVSTRLFNFQTSQLVQGIEYSTYLINKDTRDTLEILANKVAKTILSEERIVLSANSPTHQVLADMITSDTTALNLQVAFVVDTGDTLLIDTIDPIAEDTTYHSHVDLRINDTITRDFVIHDYLAYDDGTAEFGAGINQKGGKLAYQFILDQPDTLTSVDMYFPDIGIPSAGKPIEIIVLRNLNETATSVQYSQIQTIQASSRLNEFKTYDIEPDLQVKDTFYIGFIQSNDEFVPLGFDKNTDSGEKIFYNVAGTWEKNTELNGNLMLRPRFGRGEIVTGLHTAPEPSLIRMYPNPANDMVTIEGNVFSAAIYDVSGRQYCVIERKVPKGLHLDVSDLKNGLYIVNIRTGSHFISRKLLIR